MAFLNIICLIIYIRDFSILKSSHKSHKSTHKSEYLLLLKEVRILVVEQLDELIIN